MDTSADRPARAARRRAAALEILDTLDLLGRWRRVGVPVLVGSVALDLVVEPDIDIEVYSDRPSVTEGFDVLVPCTEMPGVRRLRFTNALDLDDHGLYWRLDYETATGETWKVDMWSLAHDHPGPRAADLVEPLRAALTDERRDAILAVKEEAASRAEPVAGVWIYQAVLEHGVRTYPEFRAWRARGGAEGLTRWRPAGGPYI